MAIEYPEILTDAGTTIAEALERQGLATERAADVAFAAVECLRSRWGGMNVYIPKAEYLDLAPKHQRVFEAVAAGRDPRDVAVEFKYSVQRVHQVVRAARLARAPKTTTPPLFEID